MSPSGSKPTIVIIQGSFQTPFFYQSLHLYLQSQGYPTAHPSFPSLDSSLPDWPSKTLADDAASAHAELSHLVEQEEKDVLVVAHSYGGLVASEAVTQSLTRPARQKEGKKGGVLHLFYYAAFILPVGKSVSDFPPSPNEEHHPNKTFSLKNAKKLLYNDLPDEEAELWAGRLIPQSYAVQTTPVTNEGWKHVGSTYLVCEEDAVEPKAFQEEFAAQIGAKVERCTKAHCPMLSWTEGLGNLIIGVAEKEGQSHAV